eukprot:gnl/TRDRNA2_/TRDRNA2_192587_c0_seq1.p1 gnl/TRDRNA2_/TRDRNA2_192587_c0~~gnl/TRDRNA2_/TRDRNA2_192587_c0_seq1.p1  ORF type:complete len:402 (+),score=43.97 gnl/TRDRNA2_/TRDRNA2_192587_c0_seq1:213-1418(+)
MPSPRYRCSVRWNSFPLSALVALCPGALLEASRLLHGRPLLLAVDHANVGNTVVANAAATESAPESIVANISVSGVEWPANSLNASRPSAARPTVMAKISLAVEVAKTSMVAANVSLTAPAGKASTSPQKLALKGPPVVNQLARPMKAGASQPQVTLSAAVATTPVLANVPFSELVQTSQHAANSSPPQQSLHPPAKVTSLTEHPSSPANLSASIASLPMDVLVNYSVPKVPPTALAPRNSSLMLPLPLQPVASNASLPQANVGTQHPLSREPDAANADPDEPMMRRFVELGFAQPPRSLLQQRPRNFALIIFAIFPLAAMTVAVCLLLMFDRCVRPGPAEEGDWEQAGPRPRPPDEWREAQRSFRRAVLGGQALPVQEPWELPEARVDGQPRLHFASKAA